MANSHISLEDQEKVLRDNRDFIVKHLDSDDVIDELIQSNLVGKNAAQQVQLPTTSRVEKNRIILDQLITSGPGALEKFCEILKRMVRQSFIAEELEKCIHLTATPTKQPTTLECSPLDVSKLQTRYIKQLSTEHRDWPLQYVRLVLVKGEKVTRADKDLEEITKLTLQGQVDELLLRKEPLGDLRDIFHYKKKPCPRLILIMGAPGIGKTTLANEICVKWAEDGFLAEDFDAVILISLRSVQKISLKGLVKKEMGKKNYEQMKKSAGSRCLIILEGLDEMSVYHRQNDPFLIRLIECNKLEKATIIITSRPHACEEIDAGRTIEIVGFAKDKIREFVEKSLSENTQSVEEFLQQLDKYPHLHSFCYIPMNLVMVLDIFCHSENKLPFTLTELYQQFTVMTLKRQVKRMKAQNNQVCSSIEVTATDSITETLHQLLRGLPQETTEIVMKLSRLAYRGFFDWYCDIDIKGEQSWKKWKDPKIIFAESDLVQCDIEINSNFDGYGLLTATHTHQFPTDIKTYSFNHLTMQEFLCAVYISLQSQEVQFHLLKEHLREYPNIFIFVCGLTGLESSEMFHFIYSKLTSSYRGYVMTTIRCINESKSSTTDPNPSVSPFILNLEFRDILHYDCLCVSNVLSSFSVSQLKMWGCRIGDKGAEYVAKHYPTKNITNQLLEELDLRDNDFSCEGMVHLMKIAKMSSATLKVLDVSHNNIGDEGMEVISEVLQDNTSLTKLRVVKCGLSVKGAVYISKLLKVTHTLQQLDISQNNIGDEGIAAIAEVLQHSKTLSTLEVGRCGLSMKGAISISKMMIVNHSLRQLYIWENNVGDDGISAIAEVLINCKINKLQIDECGITFTGAESIAAALSLNHFVTDLCLYRNPITLKGGLQIVKTAVHNSVCQRIEIDGKYKNEEIEKMMKILENRRKQKKLSQQPQSTESTMEKNISSTGTRSSDDVKMSLIDQSNTDDHFGGQ